MISNDEIKQRVEREKSAHEDDNVLAESYRLKDKFPHVYSYPSKIRLDKYVFETIEKFNGPLILDYGCGFGDAAIEYYKRGATVMGIDISEPYVKSATTMARELDIPETKLRFSVMDAHKLDFPEDTFDLVIGKGILHHLNWQRALNEINKVLKPGGRVLLTEPLIGSPLMRLFRQATPSARTIDEAPFSSSDIKSIEYSESWECESIYCGLISLPTALLTSIIFPRKPDNIITRLGDKLEIIINNKKILKSWNQYVLFNLIKPNH